MAKYALGTYVDYNNTQWEVVAERRVGKSLQMYWLFHIYTKKFATVLEEQITPSKLWERPETDAGTSRAVKNYDGQEIRN